MKKCAFALITMCIFMSSTIVAYADVINEPNNEFYKQHRNEIIYLGRNFTAKGADGFASVLIEPGSGRETGRLLNGEEVYLQYSCLYKGNYWGFAVQHSGWIKIDDLLVLYDYIAFDEEHLYDFYVYDGDYAAIRETRSAVAWPWPGADAPLWTLEDLDAERLWIRRAYMDEYGREWGFVAYSYGSWNIWICLSEPLRRDLPAFNPATPPMPWVSETVHTEIVTSGYLTEASTLVIVIVLVVALVAGTVVLLRVLWKSEKTKQGGDGDV